MSRRAQSVIEYLLLVTAVVVVLITGVLLKGGIFVRGVNAVLESPNTLLQKHNSDINFTSSGSSGSGSSGSGSSGSGSSGSGACVSTGCVDNENSCGTVLLDNCGNSCGTGSNCGAGYTCKDTGNMSECIKDP